MRLPAGLIAASLFAGVLAHAQPATAQTTLPPECTPTPLGCAEDLDWAIDLEAKATDHLWDGQIYEIDYNPNYDPADPSKGPRIASANDYGDSALWTGTYLASQSFRYRVAKRHLAELEAKPKPTKPDPVCKRNRKTKKRKCTQPPTPPDPYAASIAFWQTQKDQAKARVDEMVKKYEVLINISKNWNHEFDPDPNQPGFGGGVFAGEPGYLMRACIPTDTDERYRWSDAELGVSEGPHPDAPYTDKRRVFGPLPWTDADGNVTDYYCEDGTSRDAYAGVTFGLMTAFDLVGTDDAALRDRIGTDLITLVNFAVKYYWSTPRPHGRISLPIPILEDQQECTFCGHDFENFISALFVQVPLARLNMANVARHVSTTLGRSDAAQWEAVWTEELATQLPLLAGSMQFDAIQPNDSYYKYNLHHITGYNIIRTAPDATLREEFKRAMAAMDKTTGDDINAHFETVTYSMTGEQSRLDAAISHLREWTDYRTRIDANPATANSCDVYECVPEDQMETLPSGVCGGPDAIVIPGFSQLQAAFEGRELKYEDLRARCPIEVVNRPPTDFLWQRPPTQLSGIEGLDHQNPGIDYLLPYWMLRYYTEVVTPEAEPFPAWPGPAHA